MMKILKVLLLLVVLALGAAAAIGFGSDAEFKGRHEVVIDAPVDKVWAIVSDPRRTPEWFPTDMEGGGVKEVKGASLAEKALDIAKEGDTSALSRHTYVRGDGKTLTMEVVDRQPKRRYLEKVVATDTGMDKLFPEMAWGFELEPAGTGQTKLILFDQGKAAKPMGTLARKLMTWSGSSKHFMESMAKGIEKLAKAK